ncbi:MAG: isoamylase [Succinivibrionaceae bacterium]|nr:isoamylase [Succinivibrionaceae bacterium]
MPRKAGTAKSARVISPGHCRSLGATLEGDGTNFAVWCPSASCIELLLFSSVDDTDPRVVTLSSPIFRSTYFWHVRVRGVGAGQIYAWRVRRAERVYKFRSGNVAVGKVLLDPYGRRIVFPGGYRRMQGDNEQENLQMSAKSVVVDMDAYDWGLDTFPRHPFSRTVIYEMHVRGFTAHPSSGLAEELRGTYRGLVEKIPHLVRLGVTAVELLPVFQFDGADAMPGMRNYWGYSPMGFFAPHEAFSSDRSLMGPINEFRDMVKALHRHGIEVILDVVYNHTSEGDSRGPTYCFKGLDRSSYYILDPSGQFSNYSGCGNTFNATNPVVRNLILDSLIFWREQMHVDGFRFDLASILSRDVNGMPLANAPTLLDIDGNRRLADTKIIAEPWDAGGLYQLGSIAGSKWREWNGQFRDDVRSFMRGDPGVIKRFVCRLIGSPDIYNEREVDPQKSINFITCHDGFTLWDLVSYSYKHNLGNGECNRDGNDRNYSASYGYEGEIDNPEINALRFRQARNFMTLNVLAMGTPMIQMGDEVLRTQQGNNNAYCQDNEISWMNWDLTRRQQKMLDFTSAIVRMRTAFRPREERRHSSGMLDLALRSARTSWHGVRPFQPDWSDNSHSIGFSVYWGTYGIYAYVFVNAYWEDLTVEPPPPPRHRQWFMLLDTSKESVSHNFALHGINFHRVPLGTKMRVRSRSIIMLISPAV